MAALMPAHPLVSTQDIVNALLKWRGDVSNTAVSLGMARNSLYERIKRLGLDLEAFRNQGESNPVTPITTVPGMPGMRGVPGIKPGARHAQQNGGAIYPAATARRRLGAVQTGTQLEDDAAATAAATPIRTAPRRHTPLRVSPPQREALRRAAWDLQARFQVPTDENLILEQFIDEAFGPWLQSKLEAVPGTAAKPRRRRSGGEER
jgi:hypothetical protein